MLGRYGRYNVAARRLILGAVAIGAFLLAFATWQAWAEMARLRERAYPIPATKCQKAKDCDERALQVEAREAVTSDGAFDVALGQLALSILGLGGVGFTLYYAHKAWQESARSADVAERALTASTRPHVLIDRINLGDSGLGDDRYALSVHFANAGQSPAFIREYGGYVQLKPRGEEPSLDPESLPTHQAIIPILPTQTMWIAYTGDDGLPISADTWQQIRSGEMNMYLIGAISYQDSRSNKFIFRFVYRNYGGRWEPHPSDSIWYYSAA